MTTNGNSEGLADRRTEMPRVNFFPSSSMAVPWLHTIDDWPHAVGGFTGRGEHSPTDPESGFNVGHTHHADHEAVDRRRQAALASLGLPGRPLVLCEQVHSATVAVAREAELPGLIGRRGYPYYPQTDALVTAERGLALMLFFADCCPVWLCSEEPLCGGLAHCGWRGTVADMAGAVVAALGSHFGAQPEHLRAVVGPSICGRCYEVGEEVGAAVAEIDGLATVSRQEGRAHLDLPALNALLLQRHGLPAEQIRIVNSCTRCGPVPLYSWRRDGNQTGRMAGLFALR